MTSLLAQLTTPAQAGHALVCGLCAHRCVLRSEQTGRCGAIVHQGDRLRSLADGRLVALHADPVERKPLYHVLPGTQFLSLGTQGCTMTCTFCQNWRIAQARPTAEEPLTSPEAVVAAALEQGCAGIACTYNEPTIYPDYAAALLRLAKHAGLFTAYKTNGYLTPEAITLLTDPRQPLLDAANVDLKSFDDRIYRQICGARLQPVLAAITQFFQRGVWVEVTTLLIPGVNDSDAELRALTGWLAAISPSIPWHVWRFHPDYRMPEVAWTDVTTLTRAVALGREAGLHYVYTSNLPGDPNQHTRCPGCGTLLIERVGNATTALRVQDGQCGACGLSLPGRWA